MIKKPEILAPAGGVEALKAAVYAGADAVYLGGSRFGARAYAGNFEEGELLKGIDYAHLYGVKVYLTVNTLFRNDEINELYSYLRPYYNAGLDAVIVQDLGVMECIYRHFPGLPIHASTQMSITTPYSYELLKDYGVTRVVPARELSISELKTLKEWDYGNGFSAPELEVFVQGALCVCYSGQCLMSSFIGGRSGNRGRCAQSCRLPYTLLKSEGGKPMETEGKYLLSTKDLCGLRAIPALIDAGVDSFKIEGRMKKPEYVAACVDAYRQCVDYLCDTIDISEKHYSDIVNKCSVQMASVFNRGGFTSGYFNRNNGKDMMSLKAPGHMGITIGSINSVNRNQIKVKLENAVNIGDIFVIRNSQPEITLTCNAGGKPGDVINLNVPRAKELKIGMKLYRMLDMALESRLSEYKDKIRKINIQGRAVLKKGKQAVLRLSYNGIDAEYKGLFVEKASSVPVTAEIINDKLNQTGNSVFQFDHLSLDMDDDIFYPMKALKSLRREAFEDFKAVIIDSYTRKPSKKADMERVYASPSELEVLFPDELNVQSNDEEVHIIVSSIDQLKAVDSCCDMLGNVFVSLDLQYFDKRDIMQIIERRDSLYNMGLVLPMIFRRAAIDEIIGLGEQVLNSFKMITVRNIDELAYLKSVGYTGIVNVDYSLYVMNDMSAYFIRSQFSDAVITFPVELNKSQLTALKYSSYKSEWIVYNYQPLMVTASCMQENVSGCNKGNTAFGLRDRTNRIFYVRAFCKYCYNVILNDIPTVLYDQIDKVKFSGCRKRIQFSIESFEDAKNVLNSFVNTGIQGKLSENDSVFLTGGYTRGHFKRGVL